MHDKYIYIFKTKHYSVASRDFIVGNSFRQTNCSEFQLNIKLSGYKNKQGNRYEFMSLNCILINFVIFLFFSMLSASLNAIASDLLLGADSKRIEGNLRLVKNMPIFVGPLPP